MHRERRTDRRTDPTDKWNFGLIEFNASTAFESPQPRGDCEKEEFISRLQSGRCKTSVLAALTYSRDGMPRGLARGESESMNPTAAI